MAFALISRLRCTSQHWPPFSCRLASTATTAATATVRQVLSLQLQSGHAAQACVTLTQLDSKGGTQAAQAAWQALLPVLKGAKPTFLTIQTSANHQAACAAGHLLHAQLKALSGPSKVVPSVVGFTSKPWTPEGDTLAAARLTDGMWRVQRHLRITAFVLKDTDCATFHTVSESFPVIPDLQDALTVRPPHVLLLPHPSFSADKLSTLIERLESGFQGSQVLGVIPVPPLQDVDTPTAKRQLEAFQAEARGILEEANLADDLSAPLAVAAAEAENLTLSKLEEDDVPAGQEEVTVFMEDTAFMQGAVGLTLMPSHPSTSLPLSDLAQMARLVLGSDKLFGFFLSDKLKKHICEPQDQQSSIVPPVDQDETPQQAFLTEADLPFLTNQPPPLSRSPPSSTSSSPPAPQTTSPSSLPFDSSATAQTDEATSQPSVLQSNPSFLSTSDSPQQAQHEHAEAQQVLLQHANTKVNAQAIAQDTPPQPDWASTPTDASPVSKLGSATAAGQATAVDSKHPADQSSSSALRPKDWHAATVVPEGLVLQPKAGAIGAPLLQTPTQLPVFALDAVLWPNQIMILRVFEPRYRRLLKCCQEDNGCFALASYGVGTTVMLDRVQLEEDSSNSVSIRGGQRFLVQEGTAKVIPGSFGLTVVEPSYIYDTDIESAEAAALAAQAADLLTSAHAAAVEADNNQFSDAQDQDLYEGEAPEEAASRWREGVLEDAGASSSFAGVFNLDTRSRQISAPPIAAVRQRWSPAAAQELSFLLGSALPVPPTLRRRWLRCDSLTKRLRQQVELLQEARPRAIIGGILQSLPDDSRFHDLLYEKLVEQT